MKWVVARIKWLMLASGLLTCTMLYVAISPQAALRSTFGDTLEGPLADIVVRNWGILIALMGGMLIYGAYHPPSRPLVLTVAAASKLAFIGLVLSHGGHYLGQQVGVSVVVDLVMVALFLAYLIGTRRGQVAA